VLLGGCPPDLSCPTDSASVTEKVRCYQVLPQLLCSLLRWVRLSCCSQANQGSLVKSSFVQAAQGDLDQHVCIVCVRGGGL
jgi:hypothetical protein